jgi:hypothetical protein
MKKLNIDSLVKRVLEESLQEKADDLVTKIKSKVDEWNPNGPVTISGQDTDMHEDSTPNPEGCRKIKEMIANGGEDTLGKLQEYCGEGNNELEEAETEEGNAFTGALVKAKEEGKDSFKVGGKSYDIEEEADPEMEKQGYHLLAPNKVDDFKSKGMEVTQGKDKKYYTKKLSGDNVNENVLRLTETEMIDLIEKIVLEQKKAKGLGETEKVLSADKKENEDAIKAVTKKMKDYLKDMTKGSYETNPEDFPKGNGSLEKDSKVKKYTPSDAVDEYIDAFSYPGMTNLVYDEIKPNDELIDKYLTGDSTTGNAQVDSKGKALGNVVPSKVGKKFKKNFDENLYGQEQMNASYKRQPQPVDTAGEKTERGTLKSRKGKKTAQDVLNNVDESVKNTENSLLNEEFNKMKHLMGYNKNTQ